LRQGLAQTLNLAVQTFVQCLKERQYEDALPFFKLDLLELFKLGSGKEGVKSEAAVSSSGSGSTAQQNVSSTSGGPLQPLLATLGKVSKTGSQNSKKNSAEFDVRTVLLYFYYGGTILAVLERYEEALLMLEHAVCLPAVRPSAIVLESVKKYVLVSLILGRGRIELPPYKSGVVTRTIFPMAGLYMKLAQQYQKCVESKDNVAALVQDYLQQNQAAFNKDHHVGLMKRVVVACKENAIKRLGNVFISLTLDNVSNLAFIRDNEETLEITRRLCQQGQLNVLIDEATQTFHFQETPSPASDPETSVQDLDQMLAEVEELRKQIADFDEAVQICPAYIQKTARMAREGGNLFPEDEGFHSIAGNSGLSFSPPHTSN